jgi:hypothetical protein
MRRHAKIIFVLALVLLIYGYAARQFALYFFWDSEAFGWILLFIGLFFYLIDLNRSRRNQGKQTIWLKIGKTVIFAGFCLGAFLIFEFRKSNPYRAAIDYLKSDSQLKAEIGNIKGFGLIPSGTVEEQFANGAESGRATFFLTVLGDKKYKDIDVNLGKTPETDWTVISVY